MSKINEYHCKNGHVTITKDTEPRTVTPMFITCPECKERSASSFYNVNQSQEPTYEWFMPKSVDEMKEACLPIYGDVFSKKDYQQMLDNQNPEGPGMYRKIKKLTMSEMAKSENPQFLTKDDFEDNSEPKGDLLKNIKRSRNSPCYCGSGKKFKRCCVNIS